MAKTVTPLTNTQVKQAKSRDKLFKLSDGEGLQLRVMPNGSKQWLLDYQRPITKKRTSLSFRSYPDVSLANARKRKLSARELLANDIDPKEHHDDQHREKALAADHTFLNVSKTWFELKKSRVAETTAISLWRSMDNQVFPSLGRA